MPTFAFQPPATALNTVRNYYFWAFLTTPPLRATFLLAFVTRWASGCGGTAPAGTSDFLRTAGVLR
eukprot:5253982-Lingulodinium_polyedra.AAC.1